jgi:exodeoxyribonuclease-1
MATNHTFFFYDLETSGFNPRSARIMQFAGQRTDLSLKPIGEPVNVLIKLTPDVLPEPDAIMVTGITPQQTIADGISEAAFLKLFYQEVALPGTIFTGFNSVRFDDEFMRFLQYRNFCDAYEWQWQDGKSRWDILDVVRMTRALRPDGIEWPFAPDGKPANRLEFLTKVNKLDHFAAHDALSDVQATIAVAALLQTKHPELFDYLLTMREKKKVAELVQQGKPFVYTSSHYSSSVLHTTAVVQIAKHPQQDASLVYDLRHDPTPYLQMSPQELAAIWKYSKDPDAVRLPVKTLKYNRCPAIAPLGVIKDEAAQSRINLSLETITKHLQLLTPELQNFAEKLQQAVGLLDAEREHEQTSMVDNQLNVDGRLYDGFITPADKPLMGVVRVAEPHDINGVLAERFSDERLKRLLPLYKARNFPAALDEEERLAWETFCKQQLFDGNTSSRLASFFARLQELSETKLSDQQQYLLEELQLYGQSIMPVDIG